MSEPSETTSEPEGGAAAPVPRSADVVVIGSGQAGLSAAYHLRRRGFVPAVRPDGTARTTATNESSYVVLDAEAGPGGAWRHRWRSLLMATVNGIHDLPAIPKPQVDLAEPSAEMLPRYFGAYEQQLQLPVLRPVTVTAVRPADTNPAGQLLVESSTGSWSARAVINATGTWRKPFWPSYPGRDDFAGRQLHVADYVSAAEFAGQHVVVVGGGISAVQLLDEISEVTTTTWFTRREPVWNEQGEFTSTLGHEAVALVEERVRLGLVPQSVVSVTGLIWNPRLRAAAARGVLERNVMFTRLEPEGVRTADGGLLRADVVLWATGFRAALDHLAPLKLRSPGGGIVMDRTMVATEPRVHLVGYGPSASTIGANRAGRSAVARLAATLDARSPSGTP